MGYWDVCALDAICRENGGGIFKMNGKLLTYDKDLFEPVNTHFIMGLEKLALHDLIVDYL